MAQRERNLSVRLSAYTPHTSCHSSPSLTVQSTSYGIHPLQTCETSYPCARWGGRSGPLISGCFVEDMWRRFLPRGPTSHSNHHPRGDHLLAGRCGLGDSSEHPDGVEAITLIYRKVLTFKKNNNYTSLRSFFFFFVSFGM